MTSTSNQDDYESDQPWNPVSYFEEENEASGGTESSSLYSPSKLASLFSTETLTVNNDIDNDILKAKQLLNNVYNNESNQLDVSTDKDDIDRYMVDTETSGLRVLDSTYVINQKAIFHDLERLKARKIWDDSVNKDSDKPSDEEEEISYLISPDKKTSSNNTNETPNDNDSSIADISKSDVSSDDRTNKTNSLLDFTSDLNTQSLLENVQCNDTENAIDSIIDSSDTKEIDLLVDVAENIVSNQDNLNDKGTQFSEAVLIPSLENDNSIDSTVNEKPDNTEKTAEKKEVLRFDDESFDVDDEDLEYLLDNLEDDPDLQDIIPSTCLSNTQNVLVTVSSTLHQDSTDSVSISKDKTSMPEDNELIDNDKKTDESADNDVNLDLIDSLLELPKNESAITNIKSEVVDDYNAENLILSNNEPNSDSLDCESNAKGIDENNIDFPSETSISSNNLLDSNSMNSSVNPTEPTCAESNVIPSEISRLNSSESTEFKSVQCKENNLPEALNNANESSDNIPPESSNCDVTDDEKVIKLSSDNSESVERNSKVDENSEPSTDSDSSPVQEEQNYISSNIDIAAVSCRIEAERIPETMPEHEIVASTTPLQEIVAATALQHEIVAATVDVNTNSNENLQETVSQNDLLETLEQSEDNTESITADIDTSAEPVHEDSNSSENAVQSVEAENTQTSVVASDETNEASSIETQSAANGNTSGSSDNTFTENESPNDNPPDDLPPTELERSSSSVRRVRFSLNEEMGGPAITEEMRNLGKYAPRWIPDTEAINCMNCNLKFTIVRRRHHCRACGKIFCGQCCSIKFQLQYMPTGALTRVCQSCCDIMVRVANANQTTSNNEESTPAVPTVPSANLPEAPPPYSESVDGALPRLSSISSTAPPYSEAPRYNEQPAPILTASQALDILPGSSGGGNFPRVAFNEILAASLPSYADTASGGSRQRLNRNRTESEMSAVIMFNSTTTNLPPILRRSNEEIRIVNNPDLTSLFMQIQDETEDPVAFIVNKNLVVRVKAINMDCCVEKKCWCFVSDGMGASNQEEIVILIKSDLVDVDDVTLTKSVLTQMNAIFEKAKHGHPVSDLETMKIDPSMRCLQKNIGLIFFKLTLQCSKKLLLPTSPYLFGLYIEESELPWAKNFPLRLLLRIGAEFKYYPCPLFNVLDRPPVYHGIQRTILDLLADFTNFKYTVPRVNGVTINLRGKDTIIKLPQHRFDEVSKALNSNEDNVLSLAGNFSSTCDGHLVSVEKDGKYKTQTLSIVVKEKRKVTCASFIVISAALKPGPEGIKAKATIVEDGVMVQVLPDVMKEIKTAMKDMKEYSVLSGDPANPESTSQVSVEWTGAEVSDRPRLLSPIDGTSFDNLTNMKIRHSYDYTTNSLTAKIHWVEVYFLPQDNDTVQRLSARELGQMTSSIAKACMSALSPHLTALIALEMSRIGLRVNLAADFVEYKIGANLTTLPAELLPTLDDKLVPAIHSVMTNAQERVAVELIFQVVKIV